MKTVLPLVRRVCLMGSLLGVGCTSEAEQPDSLASANRKLTGGDSVAAPVGEETIREVAATDITKISPEGYSPAYHKVGRGETLSAIAARHHTTAERLAQVNGLGDPNQLAVGQWLYLPKGDH